MTHADLVAYRSDDVLLVWFCGLPWGFFCQPHPLLSCGHRSLQPGWAGRLGMASLTHLAAGAGSWLWRSMCHPVRQRGQTDILTRWSQESSPRAWKLELGHVCHILLVKASHKVSSDSEARNQRAFSQDTESCCKWASSRGSDLTTFANYHSSL